MITLKRHSVVDNITNSSSTTFIVGFEEKPKTMGELIDALFPNNAEYSIAKHVVGYGIAFDTLDVVQQIFKDLQEAEEISENSILTLACHRSFPGYPDHRVRTSSELELDALDDKFRIKYPGDNWTKHKDWEEAREPLYQAYRQEREQQIYEAAESYIENNRDKLEGMKLYALDYGNELGDMSGVIESDYGILREIIKLRLSNH